MDKATKQAALVHMIGQHEDITDSGGVRPIEASTWLNLSRQRASDYLRELVKDGTLERVGYQYRPETVAYKYYLSPRARELYEDNILHNAYMAFVYATKHGKFIGRMFQGIGE